MHMLYTESEEQEDHVVPQQQRLLDVILEQRYSEMPPHLISFPFYLGSVYLAILAVFLQAPGLHWRPPLSLDDRGIVLTPVQLSHAAAAVGFFVALLITFINALYSRNLAKRKVRVCVIYVNGISLITYCFLLIFGSPYIIAGTEEVEPIRYCQWLFTTPAIIYTVSSMLKSTRSLADTRIYATIADVVMIVTGFLERYFPSPYHEIFFMLSMVAFFFTMLHFTALADMGAVALVELSDRTNFQRINLYTFVVWTLFPVVRILSMMGISYVVEELLNTVLDVAAKLIYVVCIMVLKFASVEDILEERLLRAEDYVKTDTEREAQRDLRALEQVDDFYSRKLLAYQEADTW
eukprot:3065345-Pyramimonas_sp.AAC.1